MTVPPTLRAAAPTGIALVAAVLAVGASWRLLPRRVVLVHEPSDGTAAFAASRVDLLLLVAVLLVGLVVAYAICAAVLAWTPARHLLLPHAEHWTRRENQPEMRVRSARFLSLGFAVALWSVVAQLVLTLLAQSDGPLAAWWLPVAVSGVAVLVLLGGLVWVVVSGFSPTAPSLRARFTATPPGGGVGRADARVARAASSSRRPAGASPVATTGARTPAPRPGGAAPSAGARVPARPSRGTADGRVPRPGAAPGASAGGDGPRTGPPRPYQPRPRRPQGPSAPGSGPREGGRTPRG